MIEIVEHALPRFPVDFVVMNDGCEVAAVWGDNPDSVDSYCEHPEDCVEYDDDETVGECTICGDHCDWHWVSDEDCRYREPHLWYGNEFGGMIKEKLDQLRSKQ